MKPTAYTIAILHHPHVPLYYHIAYMLLLILHLSRVDWHLFDHLLPIVARPTSPAPFHQTRAATLISISFMNEWRTTSPYIDIGSGSRSRSRSHIDAIHLRLAALSVRLRCDCIRATAEFIEHTQTHQRPDTRSHHIVVVVVVRS